MQKSTVSIFHYRHDGHKVNTGKETVNGHISSLQRSKLMSTEEPPRTSDLDLSLFVQLVYEVVASGRYFVAGSLRLAQVSERPTPV